METIVSKQNQLLVHVRKLQNSRSYRREKGEFVCDGPKLLTEALCRGADINAIILQEGVLCPAVPESARVVQISPELMRQTSQMQSPQGILFICSIPEQEEPETIRQCLILDGIQDPGNLGTVLRTVDAFDMDCVVLLDGCADPYNPKTVQATMGAIFRKTILQRDKQELTALLNRHGLPLYAATLSKEAADIRTVDLQKAAVAVGSEGKGVSPELMAKSDGAVIIPMNPNSESLNAAVAAAIVMWQMKNSAEKI